MAIVPGIPGLEVTLVSGNHKLEELPELSSPWHDSHHSHRVVEAASFGEFFVCIEMTPSYPFWSMMLEVQVYIDDEVVDMQMIRPCDSGTEVARSILPYSPEATEDEKAEKRSLNFYEWTDGESDYFQLGDQSLM